MMFIKISQLFIILANGVKRPLGLIMNDSVIHKNGLKTSKEANDFAYVIGH